LAGNASIGVVDGVGAAASFGYAQGLTVAGGYGFVGDSGYIRRVDLVSGAVVTVAGTGVRGCGDPHPGAAATVDPKGPMAADGQDLYFLNRCGYGDTYLRRMSLSTGVIDTLFSRTSGNGPNALTIGPGGELYAVSRDSVELIDTVAKTASTVLSVPPATPGGSTSLTALAADDDYLYAVDSTPARLLRIDVSLHVVTQVSDAAPAAPLVSAGDYLYSAVDQTGQMRRFRKSDGAWGNVAGVRPQGFLEGVGSEAWLGGITGLDTDGQHIYIFDIGNRRVRMVSPAAPLGATQPEGWSDTLSVAPALVSTVAGGGSAGVVDGTGAAAHFQNPVDWTVVSGYGYTVDAGYLRRLDLGTGQVQTVAGSGSLGCLDKELAAQARVDSGPMGAMASDGTFLYWVNRCGYGDSYLRRLSLRTGAISTIFYRTSFNGYSALTVGADGLLYGSLSRGDVDRINPETGATTTVVTAPTGVTLGPLAADAGGLWGIGAQTCAGGAVNNCNTIYRLDPGTGTKTVIGGDPPLTDFHALMATGPLVSAGDYLYSNYLLRSTGTDRVGIGRWDKVTGAFAAVTGFFAAGVESDGTPSSLTPAGLDTDGRSLYALDTTSRRVARLNQLPPAMRVEQTYGPGASASDDGCACETVLTRNAATSQAVGDPVNTATGAFYEQVTDASLPGAGTTFQFTRTYNSNDTTTGRLGPGWTDPYQASLSIPGPTSDITFRAEDGAQAVFTRTSAGTYSAPPGVRSTLTTVTGGYQVTTPGHRSATFDTAGHLTARTDQHGVGLGFTWSGGRMTTITDAVGRDVTLTYDPTSGLLSQLTLPDGRHVDYGYTSGRLTTVTDLGAKTWTYGYGTAGRLTTITNPLGHDVVTNTYDPTTGRVTTQTDAEAHTSTLGWNPGTQTATVTNPDSGVWTYRYLGNVLLAVTDPTGHVTSYAYDDHLNIIAVGNAAGAVTSFTYDSRGNRLSARSPYPVNAVTRWTYDTDNHPTRMTDPLGHHTDYQYNAAGDRTQQTTPEGAVTTWHYNTDGTLDWVTDPRGNATGATPADYRTLYGYDSDANLTTVTSPLGRQTTFGYDPAGRPTSRTDPRGNAAGADPDDYTLTTTWTTRDQVHQVTDALGHTTTSTYDDAGNLATVTDPDSHTTIHSYDDNNQLSRITDPLGHHSDYTHDWSGRTTTVTDADGNTTTSEYDTLGRLATAVSPSGNTPGATAADHATTYAYDPVGNPTSVSHPLPGGGTATVSTAYDTLNRPTAVTDAGGKTTRRSYDAAGRETSVTDPLGAVTSSDYDDDGQLLAITDPNQHTTSYTYDPAGNLLQRRDPLGRDTAWTYDRDGLQASTSTPGGLVTSYDHDQAGHLTTTDFSDPATHDVTLGYDPLGRRSTMTDASGTSSYSYTNTGKLAQVTDGHGDTLGYGYDDAGRLDRLTYPGATGAVTYTYTDAGRMAGLADWANRDFTFTYNPDGQLTNTHYPNGVDTAQTYDIAGRLTALDTTHTTTAVASHTYGYNTRGLITTGTDSFGGTPTTRTYTWDDAAQLATSTSGGYAFDPAHQLTNQTTTGASYDAAGQLATTTVGTGSTSYGFNGRGDRTAATPDTGTPTAYTYSQDSHLTGYQRGSTQSAHTYDGDGLRTQTDRGTGPGATTEAYTWDIAGALPELINDGHHRYLYGPAATPLAQIDTTTGAIDYLHHDLNGSTRALTDSAGTLTATYTYDPYGTPTSHTGTATTAFGYAGEYTDPDTALVYLRARDYDPATGQFLTRDPLEDLTAAPYGYAAGNPLQLTDPSGLWPGWGLVRDINRISNTVAAVAGTVALAATIATAVCPVCAPVTAPVATAAGVVLATASVVSLSTGAPLVQHDLATGCPWKQDALLTAAAALPGVGKGASRAGAGLGASRTTTTAAEEGGGLVEGANGALRDPATGRFASNPGRVAPEPSSGLHGNSRLSDAPTSLYRLEDLNGNYLKTGITSNPGGRYTQDFMSDKFMNIINVGSRSNMMDLERFIVEFDPGPLNFEPWAGAAAR
jgi:RHS repeat-associated protein